MVVDVAAAELERVHERIAGRFGRPEPRARVREYVSGLVAGLERKNGWTLAERAGEGSPDGMQRLLRWAHWDTREVRDDVRDYVTGKLGDPQGVLIADETGFLKKGALRGDVATAETMLASLPDLQVTEDPQDQATVSLVEALTAAARRWPADTLRHAQSVLGHADAIGISHECVRWAWPLAARAAHDLADTTTTRELLSLLDDSHAQITAAEPRIPA
jgi:hypothetical protein